jgi:hypothetical protein
MLQTAAAHWLVLANHSCLRADAGELLPQQSTSHHPLRLIAFVMNEQAH